MKNGHFGKNVLTFYSWSCFDHKVRQFWPFVGLGQRLVQFFCDLQLVSTFLAKMGQNGPFWPKPGIHLRQKCALFSNFFLRKNVTWKYFSRPQGPKKGPKMAKVCKALGFLRGFWRPKMAKIGTSAYLCPKIFAKFFAKNRDFEKSRHENLGRRCTKIAFYGFYKNFLARETITRQKNRDFSP